MITRIVVLVALIMLLCGVVYADTMPPPATPLPWTEWDSWERTFANGVNDIGMPVGAVIIALYLLYSVFMDLKAFCFGTMKTYFDTRASTTKEIVDSTIETNKILINELIKARIRPEVGDGTK